MQLAAASGSSRQLRRVSARSPVLRVEERPVLEPKPGQAVVQAKAAGRMKLRQPGAVPDDRLIPIRKP
jgi:hypothetical protein